MFLNPPIFSDRNKKALAALILFLISFAATFYFQKHQSSVFLTSDQNKFKLGFELQKADEAKFSSILEKLNLAPSTRNGIEFELDSTSSAKLAALTPIRASTALYKDGVSYKGTLKRNFNPSQPFENIQIPSSASAALLSPDFRSFLKKNLNTTDDLSSWIDNNVISRFAQYLVIFGENSDFAVIFKNEDINLVDLKNIKDEAGEPIYKEEAADGANFALLKLGDSQLSPTIFEKNEWNYIVSSQDAAKQLEQSIDSAGQTVTFPDLPQSQDLSLVINFASRNNSEFFKYFFTGQPPKIIEKIENFRFVLKDRSFFGSFSVK
ncbi:MAG: hypothetical protein WD988_04775 [Candidatus Curtissbacteria bacterium]